MEKSAHLQYQPNLPVRLTSVLTLDISHSLPGLSLSTKGKQTLEADLTLSQEKGSLPISQPPFTLTILLKGVRLDLQANDEKLSFDSADGFAEQGGSAYLSQLSELINRPIVLHFGEDFVLSHKNESLKKAMEVLPVLQEINLEGLLDELLSPLFAAAGKQLVVGQIIERDFIGRNIPSLPQKMIYTITEIDDYHVSASLRGEIKKHPFDLRGKMSVAENESASISASLSGTVEGVVRWNRDNALLHSLQLEYSYAARFQLADWEWLMHVSLKAENQTKLRD